MKVLGVALLALSLVSGSAAAADYKVLRSLQAPAPIQLASLPAGTKTKPVKFARIVIHPKDGEAWALAYESWVVRGEGAPPAVSDLLTWDSGRVEAETASFQRAFDDELRKAGFAAEAASSLFAENESSSELLVGVLVDDIKGRFCLDCPNLFNRKAVPASVVMSANWEIYSALDRKVIAKIATAGGANHMQKPQSVQPAVLEAFRENVRRLLATEEFRAIVTGTPPSVAAQPALTPIAFRPPVPAKRPISNAATAVAAVFAGDGHGSGFLISSDGYLLTNQHVVGGSKFVKVRWSDGAESVGEVVRLDRRRDIALVKVDAGVRKPLALRRQLGDLGEAVFAIGTPLDPKLQGTVTKGIVSANRVLDGQAFIQSDVVINGGNSGGPLLDESGNVIGVTVAGYEIRGAPVGLNLFIPIDDALKVLALQPAS